MVKTFNGLDNEFAVSTGSNVNSSPGRSKFDYPPTSSTNLTVTSQEGDTDPNLFEVGETYTVSWSGASSGTILDATVIRSADAPDGGGGVIVFKGLDENGNLAQVLWSPSFDLESWYFDNFNGGGATRVFHLGPKRGLYPCLCVFRHGCHHRHAIWPETDRNAVCW